MLYVWYIRVTMYNVDLLSTRVSFFFFSQKQIKNKPRHVPLFDHTFFLLYFFSIVMFEEK